MCNRSDLNWKFWPHQLGANAQGQKAKRNVAGFVGQGRKRKHALIGNASRPPIWNSSWSHAGANSPRHKSLYAADGKTTELDSKAGIATALSAIASHSAESTGCASSKNRLVASLYISRGRTAGTLRDQVLSNEEHEVRSR
jgi:hypothetical protein